MRLINVGIAIVLMRRDRRTHAERDAPQLRGGHSGGMDADGHLFHCLNNPLHWAFTESVFAFAAGLWSATHGLWVAALVLLGAAATGAVCRSTSRTKLRLLPVPSSPSYSRSRCVGVAALAQATLAMVFTFNLIGIIMRSLSERRESAPT